MSSTSQLAPPRLRDPRYAADIEELVLKARRVPAAFALYWLRRCVAEGPVS